MATATEALRDRARQLAASWESGTKAGVLLVVIRCTAHRFTAHSHRREGAVALPEHSLAGAVLPWVLASLVLLRPGAMSVGDTQQCQRSNRPLGLVEANSRKIAQNSSGQQQY